MNVSFTVPLIKYFFVYLKRYFEEQIYPRRLAVASCYLRVVTSDLLSRLHDVRRELYSFVQLHNKLI
ncbi:unnamed protein product [Trichobilharzia szidati]|nr:unnamed protein product [Trichobilharzia szidati]